MVAKPRPQTLALCIPYEVAGTAKGFYPDFLVFRRDGGDLKIDLLDPHLASLEDAPAKAVGLAKFASKHEHAFGRIEMIIVDGDRTKRIDLKDEVARDRVKEVSTSAHLRHLFDRE